MQFVKLIKKFSTFNSVFLLPPFLVLNAVLLYLLGYNNFFIGAIITISTLLLLQALFTLYWLTFAWKDLEGDFLSKPKIYNKRAKYSFTILIPALHEEEVIANTIKTVSEIDYPRNLFEIIVLNRSDDKGTISEVRRAIKELKKDGKENIKLLIPKERPRNKPDKLNYGLKHATGDIVVIFDAEDEVHKDILKVANAQFLTTDYDVIQSGVQLMNFRSTWFSALNCLEYFYWFKSALHFFSQQGVTPLGGVTVFFKRDLLLKHNGWDGGILTEDAEIGIRLSSDGVKTGVIYDSEIATRESTPLYVKDFIKQRTRWNLGFLQIIAKGEWRKLPTFRQKALAIYVLMTPIGQTLALISIPVNIYLGLVLNVPIWVSLYTIFPLALLLMLLMTQIVVLYDFTRTYNLKYPFFYPLKLAITFVPYLLMLSYSAIRAIIKFYSSDFAWEKTPHTNTHRESEIVITNPSISKISTIEE